MTDKNLYVIDKARLVKETRLVLAQHGLCCGFHRDHPDRAAEPCVDGAPPRPLK